RGLCGGDAGFHPFVPSLRCVHTRLRRGPAVAEEPLPRQRALGVVELSTTELDIGLGLRELGFDVGILDAGDHLAGPYPVRISSASSTRAITWPARTRSPSTTPR